MKAALLFFCLASHILPAQDYTTFTTIGWQLQNASTSINTFKKLQRESKLPYAVHDSVLFIYQGEAESVKWMGDFNGWGYDKKFQSNGTHISGTDIWILKASFPNDARLDYKIVLNNTNWILDPNNPNQQWSGVGGGSPNSELRMPAFKADNISNTNQDYQKGKIVKDVLLSSKILGYQIMYTVYLPANYNATSTYPAMFVTDGYEYLHENMGKLIPTLDGLISERKIQPVIGIFIDHREPVNRANNRRMTELAINDKYLDFFIKELIPAIEQQYSISKKPEERAIIGTSMGGLTAAYFSFSRPDIFGLAGIQSPAFWFRPEIYSLCDNPENPPVKVFMTTGTINDTAEGALKMKSILDKNTCTYQYKEVNQGHSWGNWRDLMDDILIYFFPPK
jgi:enterochelin esterase-like enzyme